ncbi:hypothetical protein M501DRAFT_911060, partial [Patellaria atrata CBS 101060]
MPRSTTSELGVTVGLRKKMRKGTHSCFECTRRKIRCTFSPENPSVCTECFARGSKCIDQEHAVSEIVVDQRKNLRERVARLEALVDGLLEGSDDPAEALKKLRSEAFPPTPISEDAGLSAAAEPAPLLSMFDNVLSRAESQTSGSPGSSDFKHSNSPVSMQKIPPRCTYSSNGIQLQGPIQPELAKDMPSSTKAKDDRTRRALLAAFPPYEQMVEALKTNGEFWMQWREKTPGTSPGETLIQFMTRVLSSGNPSELGTLALAVGVALQGDDIDRYLALVHRWIVFDDEYASTLHGMECILFAGKCYSDIGQARRAWLAFRRGLIFAQLTGLHRNHAMDPARDSIFWGLYTSDRFLSMMLGLPYGINDLHCDLEIRAKGEGSCLMEFMAKVSVIAGEVIDRTQGFIEHSYSTVLDLDQRLDNVLALMPADWYNVNNNASLSAESNNDAAVLEVRERLLTQITYHQVRVYLHLPFMLKSASTARFEYSKTACFDSAREMLRLYQLLRQPEITEPLYECKSIDFLAFTASIVVILRVLGYGKLSSDENPEQDEKDWQAIEKCKAIFRRASSEKGGKVAAQSYAVLQQLGWPDQDQGNGNDQPQKVAIPFFGTISIRRGEKFTHRSSRSNSVLNTPASYARTGSSASPVQMTHHHFAAASGDDPLIAYDGLYMPNPSFDPQPMDLTSIPDPSHNMNAGPWQSMPNMDIDMDWTWLLENMQQQQ